MIVRAVVVCRVVFDVRVVLCWLLLRVRVWCRVCDNVWCLMFDA